jgi:hypothetical protein
VIACPAFCRNPSRRPRRRIHLGDAGQALRMDTADPRPQPGAPAPAPAIDPALNQAEWLRRIDAAATEHIRTRIALDNLIANARAAGVPFEAIEGRSPYEYGLAKRVADQVDTERITGHTAPEHLLPQDRDPATGQSEPA